MWHSMTQIDVVLGIVLCVAVSLLVLQLIALFRVSEPAGHSTDIAAVDPTQASGRDLLAFYGLHPQWTRPDRFYKVYATSAGLHGAWIGGQLHDAVSVQTQLAMLGPLVRPVINWVNHRRSSLEGLYDQMIRDPASVSRHDARNFVLACSEVTMLRINGQPSWWTAWRDQGSLVFEKCDGTTIWLIIRGEKDARTVARCLQALGFPVELPDLACRLPWNDPGMDDNPYKSPRESGVFPAEIELARGRSQLAVLKPTLAAASSLATLSLSVAVFDRNLTVAVASLIFLGMWFVVAFSCAMTASRLRTDQLASRDSRQ
jgi:hypothetical protein